ncbi:unnamed protein product [Chondrus crispus]|uniref:Coiled-coil domain-containing protein 86 n=1 Tax=Chondrus crispus TaxID=2769 RepID=R7Q5J3_CHOCR|nr:unnamed protein product [Chondrus crispus]CDF33289.1 unnamed protein product [Chondrus crispus]|eukprot:XP_005713092.1 unnamed protein product [Chondrus crispus]
MDVDSSPSARPSAPTDAPNPTKPQIALVPSTKGHRPWKKPKTRRASAQRRTASLKISLEMKNKRRQDRAALLRIVKAAKEADANSKQAERKRRADKRKLKEENERRSTQKVVITNPKKLARMSKKQYLKYVHQSK